MTKIPYTRMDKLRMWYLGIISDVYCRLSFLAYDIGGWAEDKSHDAWETGWEISQGM